MSSSPEQKIVNYFDTKYKKVVAMDNLLTDVVTTKKRRSLLARLFQGLFTKEWDPKRKFDVKVERKASSRIILDDENNVIYAHSEIIKQISDAIDEKNKKGA